MKKLEPKVGDVVAFNKLPDAAWFDVLEIQFGTDGTRFSDFLAFCC
jgi:hypothetical protein